MKNMGFKYRENNYFNSSDYYLVETNLGLVISKLSLYNGMWFTISNMRYKATSVRTVKVGVGNLIGSEVEGVDCLGNKGLGTINKVLYPNQVGVNWKQGQRLHTYFWNNINHLKIK